jgi:hypothetical protein
MCGPPQRARVAQRTGFCQASQLLRTNVSLVHWYIVPDAKLYVKRRYQKVLWLERIFETRRGVARTPLHRNVGGKMGQGPPQGLPSSIFRDQY